MTRQIRDYLGLNENENNIPNFAGDSESGLLEANLCLSARSFLRSVRGRRRRYCWVSEELRDTGRSCVGPSGGVKARTPFPGSDSISVRCGHRIVSPLCSHSRDILLPALSLQPSVMGSHRGRQLEDGRQAQGLSGKGFLGENRGLHEKGNSTSTKGFVLSGKKEERKENSTGWPFPRLPASRHLAGATCAVTAPCHLSAEATSVPPSVGCLLPEEAPAGRRLEALGAGAPRGGLSHVAGAVLLRVRGAGTAARLGPGGRECCLPASGGPSRPARRFL